MQKDFECVVRYCEGHGVDLGCGTNRLSPDILALDQQSDHEYSSHDLAWNCVDLNISQPFEFKGWLYTWKDESLDFIFSSHCLEDFIDIPTVFLSWWKKLKLNGLMILLLPDIEGGRYPKVGEEGGNPSHKTNVGKNFILAMLDKMKSEKKIDFQLVQCDTVPHNESCSIDFVIRKI